MGLIRFLFFLLILWVLWFMVKNWLRKQSRQQELRDARASQQAKVAVGKVVRCKQCEIHLPEQEALQAGDDWFCTQAHKQAWLDKNRN